jgi:hypothetical protein
MPTFHRVYAKTARRPSSHLILPRPTSTPREYIDRFGESYLILWNGQKADPPLSSYGMPTMEASS